MAQVVFRIGTVEQFNSLSDKDPNTLYFVKGSGSRGQLYKGSELYASNDVEICDTVPEFTSAADGVIYTIFADSRVDMYVKGTSTMMQIVGGSILPGQIASIGAFDASILAVSSGTGNDSIPTTGFVIEKTDELQKSKQDTVAFNTAYDASSNKAATMTDITNAVAGLAGAMRFKGIVEELPATADPGDVYICDNLHYVYVDSTQGFVELGDGSLYAIKGDIRDADIAADASISQSKIANLASDLSAIGQNIGTLQGVSHTHQNKTVLDGITEELVTAWNAKQDEISFNSRYDATANKAATMADVEDVCPQWLTMYIN